MLVDSNSSTCVVLTNTVKRVHSSPQFFPFKCTYKHTPGNSSRGKVGNIFRFILLFRQSVPAINPTPKEEPSLSSMYGIYVELRDYKRVTENLRNANASGDKHTIAV